MTKEKMYRLSVKQGKGWWIAKEHKNINRLYKKERVLKEQGKITCIERI